MLPAETKGSEELDQRTGIRQPRVADIDLFHRRESRHRVGAVRAVVRVPQAERDAPGDEFLPAFGATQRATRRVAPLARYTVSRRTARLTGHALRRMKQVNISDPWLSNSGSLVKIFRTLCLRREHGCLRSRRRGAGP